MAVEVVGKFLKDGVMLGLKCDTKATLKEIKSAVVIAYLKYYHHNISKVSRMLDISRQSIYGILNNITDENKSALKTGLAQAKAGKLVSKGSFAKYIE